MSKLYNSGNVLSDSSPCYGEYISQLIRFAIMLRTSTHEINAKLLQLGYRYIGISIVGQLTESVSSFLIHHGGYHDLFVCP